MTAPRYSYSALPPNPPTLNLTSHSPNYLLLRSLQKNWTYRSLIHIPIYHPAIGLVAGDHYFEWRVTANPAPVSRTQILLTKITQICQEIRDIRRSKINNIITKLPELSQHHIHIPESSDNYDKDDPGDVYCRNSSSNHPKDQSHSPNTCPLYGQPYAPMPPSLTP